jgi:hypothetical protein
MGVKIAEALAIQNMPLFEQGQTDTTHQAEISLPTSTMPAIFHCRTGLRGLLLL